MKKNKNKYDFLRHPLFLTLLGISLSSILIPLISLWYNSLLQNEQNKMDLQKKIIEKSMNDKILINHLITTLATYEKYSKTMDEKELLFEKRKKRIEIEEIYSNINKSLWFWWEEVSEVYIRYGFKNKNELYDKLFNYHKNYKKVIGNFSDCRDLVLINSQSNYYNCSDCLINLFTIIRKENDILIKSALKIVMDN